MTHHNSQDFAPRCPSCEIGPFVRNHYFTGKLMLERDFTDEQRYYIQKLRHHHQRLHGWGVVCGLKVKQHANPRVGITLSASNPGRPSTAAGMKSWFVRKNASISPNYPDQSPYRQEGRNASCHPDLS